MPVSIETSALEEELGVIKEPRYLALESGGKGGVKVNPDWIQGQRKMHKEDSRKIDPE